MDENISGCGVPLQYSQLMYGLLETDGLVGECGRDRCPYLKPVKAQKHFMDNADGSRVVQQAIHFDIPLANRYVVALNV